MVHCTKKCMLTSCVHTIQQTFPHRVCDSETDGTKNFDTNSDTFAGSKLTPRPIPIIEIGLNWDRYQENVPGLILSKEYICKKQNMEVARLRQIPRLNYVLDRYWYLYQMALVSTFSIQYRYSRLSLDCASFVFGRATDSITYHYYNCHRTIDLQQSISRLFIMPFPLSENDDFVCTLCRN